MRSAQLLRALRSQPFLAAISFVALIAGLRAQDPPAQPFPRGELPPPNLAAPEMAPPLEYFDLDDWLATSGGPLAPRGDWYWQLLPDGILYRAYLANPKEARIGTQIFSEQDDQALWDSTLGGRVGLLRYGTGDTAWPQGWQLDAEGSAQVRLDPDQNLDVRSVDYRVGGMLTYGYGRNRLKLGYYHLCSHVGDEFLIANPTFPRLNFVRDTVTLGYAYYITDNLRLYNEAGLSFHDEVSKPWEFQFGLDYAPALPTGLRGSPFFAVGGHLRQELSYSGNFVLQAGWAWRGSRSSHLLRTGLHYYNGLSDQYSFFRRFEQQIGYGLWYDY
jgi:uncharacterized protein DUF1207